MKCRPTPYVTPRTLAATGAPAPSCPMTSTPASVLLDGQVSCTHFVCPFEIQSVFHSFSCPLILLSVPQSHCPFVCLPVPLSVLLSVSLSLCVVSGAQCELVDSCVSSPCSNGGICTSLPDEKFSCKCPPGYDGSRCQTDVDECLLDLSPCRNGGKCLNVPGSYRCNCAARFTGSRCEKEYIPCSPSPCMNGGTCRQTSETSYWCHCLPGKVMGWGISVTDRERCTQQFC